MRIHLRHLFLIFAGFWLAGFQPVSGQDAHFTQFANAPLRLSPAMTGVFDGGVRLVANYRNQWSSFLGGDAFTTYAASVDMRFFAVQNDFVAIGLNIMSDRAGESQYNQTQGHFTVSYLKQLAGNRRMGTAQYLVAAGQVGMGQHGINWETMRFSLQFDGDAFNPGLPNGETMMERSKTYMDINAGLMWYGIFDERRSLYFGGAIHHLNSPDISFFNTSSETLYTKFSFHGGGELPMGDYLSILPGGLFMKQGPSVQLMAGANFRYKNDEWNEVALRAGVWGRMVGKYDNGFGTDALSVVAGIEFQRFNLIASYDINTSTLIAATNRRGAFELSFVYTHPQGTRGEMKCPKF